MQSFPHSKTDVGIIPKTHVGIIMDGNGRWATRRALPRTAGHQAGVKALREIVSAAPHQGIGTLTLYAFSADNWRRPAEEVGALMLLLRRFMLREVDALIENGVRLSVVGRRDRLPRGLATAIGRAEASTHSGQRLHLRIALDYSARAAIHAAAAAAAQAGDLTQDGIARRLGPADAPDVDLVIRTGGEQRLSDFLLWESAYAELFFTTCSWPDFDAVQLGAAISAFRGRDRRFGGLSPTEVAA